MSDVSEFLDVGGCRLHYKTTGETNAPAWTMIHAGVADLTQWDPQVAAFSDRYRMVRYDTRGLGQSVTEDVPFSNRNDLLQLLDHLDIGKTIVMGCSRGGQIALDFTLEYPERVTALIWVCGGIGGFEGAPPPPEEEALYQEMTEAYEAKDFPRAAALDVRVWAVGPRRDPATVSADLKDWMYRICLRSFQTHAVWGQPIRLDPPAVGRLSEVKVPTLVVIGEEDTADTLTGADFLAKNVPGAVLQRIRDAAHIPNRERPEAFNAIVRSFLDSAGI